MRPPSSGNPGSKLNSARLKLIQASDPARASSIAFEPAERDTAQNPPASARLESGPATAILNSSIAREGSRAILATPPKMKSVMETTGIL